MKNIYLILLLVASAASAQTTERITNSQDQPVYNDVSGSPFFLKEWSDGIIRFSSGRVANQFKVKFDCVKNLVILQFEGSSFTTESKIREFALFPKGLKKPDSLLFRKGFPATGSANEDTYYQVLVQGKNTLLCLPVKVLSEEPQIASKVIYRRIRDEYEYYLLKDGRMIKLTLIRQELPALFPDHQEELKTFITDKQLRFRDAGDLITLIQYYNSL